MATTTKNFYEVTYGDSTFPVMANNAEAAIRGFVKNRSIGRYSYSRWQQYTNEAGLEETQVNVRGRRINFVVYAVARPVETY